MYFKDLNLLFNYVYLQEIGEGEIWWIAVASESRSFVPGLITAMNNKQLEFYGMIVPGILWHEQFREQGFLALKMNVSAPTVVVNNFDSETLKEVDAPSVYTVKSSMFVIYDGYSFLLDHFIRALSNSYAEIFQIFGVGAGIEGEHIPSIFSKTGFLKNGAFLLFPEQNASVSVRHGFRRIGMPLTATKTKENVLVELNYRKAFSVYQELLKKNTGISVPIYDFANTAIDYPLGIMLDSNEDLVRDLLAVTNAEEIISMGEVSEGNYVGLLQSTDDDRRKACDQVIRESMDTPLECSDVFISLCNFRERIPGYNRAKEMKRIFDQINEINKDVNGYGLITIGQISPIENNRLGRYYKSIMACSFYK